MLDARQRALPFVHLRAYMQAVQSESELLRASRDEALGVAASRVSLNRASTLGHAQRILCKHSMPIGLHWRSSMQPWLRLPKSQ